MNPALPSDQQTVVTPVNTDQGFAGGQGAFEESLPGYLILEELGRGGMGIVYRAEQLALKRVVALKLLLGGLHAGSKDLARLRIEAEAVARLQHPNIVQIHEVGEKNGYPYLCLELVEGVTLETRIAGAPQLPRQAAKLVETLARAIHHAHENGILHRDLKPSNVLVTADGIPKITDFGLAKILNAHPGPTATEACLGTPYYMSPEQAMGKTREVGPGADIYSLGVILYELLTGRPPFRGNSVLDTLEQVRTQDPLPPTRLGARVARDLETICLKCLQKEPERRYASALDLAEDLRRFQEGDGIQARPTARWRRLWKGIKRRPFRAAAVALSMALLLSFLVAWPRYRQLANQAALREADEKHQRFVQKRNEALFSGTVTAPQGELFADTDRNGNVQATEKAARAALALAGTENEAGTLILDPFYPGHLTAEIRADCYTLLLVLAEAVATQSSPTGPRNREALTILDRAPRLGIQTRAYHWRRSHLLEQLGREKEAREERSRALAVPPECALDHFLSGEEQYKEGNLEQAIHAFNSALALEPGHFWARFFLALCHLKLQQWEAAKAGLNACVAQQPGFVWIYLYRSFVNEELKELEAAEADFQKALQLDPNEDARYVLFSKRGIVHFLRKEWDRAVVDFQSAIALKPERYHAYLNLARVYLSQGKFAEAAAQVERALPLSPPPVVLYGYHIERGRTIYQDGNPTEALKAFDTALHLLPDAPEAWDLRARMLLELKRYAEALRSINQFLQRGGTAEADVFRGRGLAEMKLGHYLEAVDDYTRALAMREDPDLYQYRGWAYFFADAWKPALRDFDKAIAWDSLACDPYIGRGLARVMLGQYREGVADALQALGHEPRTPEMMHNVACLYALAAVRVDKDEMEPSNQALARDYRQQALKAIRKTLTLLPPAERLPFWKTKILPDAALGSLRHSGDLSRLEDDFFPASKSK